MATLRIPALRNLLGRQSLPPLQRARAQQRRWAQVHDVRFLATTQQVSRSVHEKYREKLDRKAREAGVKDVSELKEVYRDRIQELKKKDNVSIPGLDALLADEPAPTITTAPAQTTTMSPDGLSQTPPPPPRPQGQQQQPGKTSAAIKPLSEILDLPKARELPEKELSAIWRLRHASDPRSVCAVVPAETYKVMRQTARSHPSFVLPVPRGEGVGAEIHFLQWVFTTEDDGAETATVLFTQLAEYKARGEFAQPHTSVTHHWDSGLAEKAGVVLMSGSVVEGRGASVADAQWLVMLLQRYYVDGEAGAKRALLNQFSKGDPTFSVEKLLEESEKFI
ncbi:ATP11-domain-containing protein [Hypoxylon rubiginosum]|uniref:ATP11-domain-containing protein n=1 Tax=Hypoxylon rubiginosum TaxID=110542 RepID=A0ACC0DLP6_9PEZI|nr:ATP11-domain-containing protein [Hypoxylon rubiginosum]